MLSSLKFSGRLTIIMGTANVLTNPLRNSSSLPLLKQEAYINGEWVSSATNKVFPVSNPANGSVLANVPDMDVEDLKIAIKAASTAFEVWKETTAYERSKVMRKWFDLLMMNEEKIGLITTLECGKPLAESIGELRYGASYIEYYAEEARRINGEILPSTFHSKKYLVEKQPIGVVGLITAFNFPVAMITRKVAAALAAGCTCIVKPSTDTPLSALAIAELADEAGIPKGVVNVVTSSHSSNPSIVDYLCKNPEVKGLSLTGSVRMGKIINEKCAPLIKRVGLELGGNAPFIVYDSANMTNTIKAAIAAKFRNAGQTCIAPNRFFVQEGVFDCFVNSLAEEMKKLKMGDGTQKNIQVGPLIHINSIEKMEKLVDDAVSKGANLIIGGKRAPSVGELFYEPTILTDIEKNMLIYSEEIFGPVVSVMKFKSEEDSLKLANDTDVGLASYIFSEDVNQIFRVSKRLEVGMVGVNEGIISAPEIPFGGVKLSGIGREGGHQGIHEFIDYKYVCLGNLNL